MDPNSGERKTFPFPRGPSPRALTLWADPEEIVERSQWGSPTYREWCHREADRINGFLRPTSNVHAVVRKRDMKNKRGKMVTQVAVVLWPNSGIAPSGEKAFGRPG